MKLLQETFLPILEMHIFQFAGNSLNTKEDVAQWMTKTWKQELYLHLQHQLSQ